jgi:hypothetical protein
MQEKALLRTATAGTFTLASYPYDKTGSFVHEVPTLALELSSHSPITEVSMTLVRHRFAYVDFLEPKFGRA